MTPGAKHFWNFLASSGGTGLLGLRMTRGIIRYEAVAEICIFIS